MQDSHYFRMGMRLRAALGNEEIRAMVTIDLCHTLKGLGVENARAAVKSMLGLLQRNDDIRDLERIIHAELGKLRGKGDKPLYELIQFGLYGRAAMIYDQVGKFFHPGERVIDWGCGNGMVTNLLHERVTDQIVGYDVCSYPAANLRVPIHQFDGFEVPVKDGHFEAGLITNVLHHEDDNDRILQELGRIICNHGRLVVIETVPITEGVVQKERTFVNDYVYNRLIGKADIPVPGTYETTEDWVKRFYEHGFNLEVFSDKPNPEPLGYDQPLIRDYHVLYVLRRMV